MNRERAEVKNTHRIHVVPILKATVARVAVEVISHYVLVKDMLAFEELMTVVAFVA